MPITPPHQTPDAASSIVDNQQAPLAGNPRAHVEVGVLGPLRVVGQWGPIPLPAAKRRAVLTALALRPGTWVSVAGLIAALWGQDPPRTAEKLVQGYVSGLRRALPAGTITTVAGGYVLALEPHQVDAERFEALVDGARRLVRRGHLHDAAGALREALHLWRGRPLVDLTDQPFGMAEAARLEELHRGAEEDLADARLAGGEHRDAVAGLEAAVADEPLRERRWGQLMLAMYRSGRQADALRTYQRLRHRLGEELGIQPNTELRVLEEAILLQKPELDWHRQPRLDDRGDERTADMSSLVAGYPAASSGTITFLFTGIGGWADLFEQYPEAVPIAWQHYDTLARSAIDKARGRVFKTMDDTLGAAFVSGTATLEPAGAAQRASHDELWPKQAVILVRMGLNTGEPIGRDGD